MTNPELYQRQLSLEASAIDRGRQRYLSSCETSGGNRKATVDQPTGQAILRTLVRPFADALKDHLYIRKGSKRARQARTEILKTGLTELEIAYLSVRQVLLRDLVRDTDGVLFSSLCVTLGRTLVQEAKLREFHKEHRAYVEKTLENHELLQAHPSLIVKAVARGKERLMGTTELDRTLSNLDAYAMGEDLIKVLLQVCGDWFRRTQGKSRHRPVKVLPTTKLLEWLRTRDEAASMLSPVFRPMIIKPLDWSSHNDGGYLSIRENIVLSKNPLHRHRTEVSAEARRALNIAQGTAWRVNERVYQTALYFYNLGTGLAGLTSLVEIPGDLPEGANPEELKAHKHRQLKAYHAAIKSTSGRTDERMKLDIAREYRQYDKFYFPYVLDWRSRVYPLATTLTPQGDGLAKGLLEFAEGKPLGPNGAHWLAIHGANVFGQDKLPYPERVQWVLDNEAEILKSGADPQNSWFWMEADEPFKFLAFCVEWQGYRDNPDTFHSHLPVALDGTCSGLQHFSALLRDSRGGASVNLIPASKPSDIYLEVAEELNKGITNECWQSRAWEGFINRTTCKRGTMTQPYGVTRHGLADQLIDLVKTDKGYAEIFPRVEFERARVRDRMSDEDWEAYDDKPSVTRACLWLSERLAQAIDQVVIASASGKRFLNSIASAYSRAGLDFSWVTPAGVRVSQGYRKPKVVQIATWFGKTRVDISIAKDEKVIPRNASKSKAGSSPNFIHSLDATHLLWTVLEGYDLGGIKDFALVHDSFGVHAKHIDTLNLVLRSTFVKLYSQPILENLLAAAKADLPEEFHGDLPSLPKRGDLDLEVVRLSPYIFM